MVPSAVILEDCVDEITMRHSNPAVRSDGTIGRKRGESFGRARAVRDLGRREGERGCNTDWGA